MSVDLLTRPGPRVFTLPPAAPFMLALARGLTQALSGDDAPFALTDAVVLTPTRRSARGLAEAFVEAGAQGAALLPTLRALGDLEPDQEPFGPSDILLAATPPIAPARRRFNLAALLLAKDKAAGRHGDPAGALALADQLAGLLDEAALEPGADFTKLVDIRDKLPAHLQEAAAFLDILNSAWPALLEAEGRVDPGAHRDAVLRALAARWQSEPPDTPIIIAGSTGTVPATAELMGVVARLPLGAVVLPGLDLDMDQAGWEAIDDGHPQSALKRLLSVLGVARDQVVLWPGAEETPAASARRRVVNDALRPATATADWLDRIAALRARATPDMGEKKGLFGLFGGAEQGASDPVAAGLEGMSLIEAADEQAEARAVAAAVRAELEDAETHVLIITPDRALVARIEAVLARWGIALDTSTGEPLTDTGAGAFLALVAELALDPGDPVVFAALAGHPLMTVGRSPLVARAAFADIDRLALRGVRAGEGFDALRARLAREGQKSEVDIAAADALIAEIDAALSRLSAFADQSASIAELATAHAQVVEALAKTDTETGARRVWRGEAGAGGAGLVRDLINEADVLPEMTLADYERVWSRLAGGVAVRGADAERPRVRALSPLEARLQTADLTILCGLNEGVWPAPPAEDPFVSRTMREVAGLPSPERRFGQSAHDFAQAACAPKVLLTRSERAEGAPAVASRWIWRLAMLTEGAGLRGALDAPDYGEALARLDRSGPASPPAPRPMPRPPVSARPRTLSASRVREWVRDPYGLYARQILKLKPAEPLDRLAGGLERGNAIHDALEAVMKQGGALPTDFADQLAARMLKEFKERGASAIDIAREAPRFARAAAWFADEEAKRRQAGWAPIALEAKGHWTYEGPAGQFLVHARADRIDQNADGFAILDYKTGIPPTVNQVKSGLEPQMGIEAAILASGGYADAKSDKPPAEILVIRIRGGRVPGHMRWLTPADEIASETLDKLIKRIILFDDPSTAYVARLQPFKAGDGADYARLARRGEWTSGEEGG